MRLSLAFLLLAVPAGADTLVGVVLSNGMGEGKLAPYIEQRATFGAFRVSGQGELSRKVESGRGYRLGADAEWFGPLILTAGYRYRDGGSWAKQGAWLGGGIGNAGTRLTLRRELGHEQTLALAGVLSWRRLEAQASAYRYHQHGTHHGATLLLGVLL